VLARAYEITRKTNELASVTALCMQKFNATENPRVFEKMAKIVMLPKLTTTHAQDAKTLLKLFGKLEELDSGIPYIDAFNYLHARA
jgi:hypothetical protein